MKIKRNKYIPFGRYKAINLFGVLYVKNNARISDILINHEEIHTAQMKELLYVFFYLLYGIEWLIRFVAYSVCWLWKRRDFDIKHAYRNISFEREAYQKEKNLTYLDKRRKYAWIKYINK